MSQPTLERAVGLPGAVLLGLGSIVGTGVFVSIGLGADVAGASVCLALVVAAGLAGLNGVSSAQLAAAHPVSGGTYEYAYRMLGPRWGFTAGVLFLVAKSASAATAALGVAGYVCRVLELAPGVAMPLAVLVLVVLTSLVRSGVRRSNLANAVLLGFAISVLGVLVVLGLGEWEPGRLAGWQPGSGEHGWPGFFEACALLFVAYTGYGRIATLGEEVVDPRRTIPRAIGVALAAACTLYVAVGLTGVVVLGAGGYAQWTRTTGAPLERVGEALGGPVLALVVALAATAAMAGVLLNLLLGLSRVVLAMGRRGDLPARWAEIDPVTRSPDRAIVVVAALIAGLICLADVRLAWSFSAFTVLGYYGLTNLAATRLSAADRLFPVALSWAGLAGCLSLAAFVEPAMVVAGLAVVGLAHGLRAWIGPPLGAHSE